MNDAYYKDYIASYINITSIPYKNWTKEIVEYALKKEPYTYYENLIKASINGETPLSPYRTLMTIPITYRTFRIYKRLLDYDYKTFFLLVPNEYLGKIKIEKNMGNLFVKKFESIPEKERTPELYKTLSKISLEDYIMQVINFHDIPKEYLTKKKCMDMFYSNIEKYISEIPDIYKSQELCDLLVRIDFAKYFKYIPEVCRTPKMYEEFVQMNPTKNIKEVPKEKQTQGMYDLIFEYGIDHYIDLIPEKYRSKKMYHRLIRINQNKYLPLMPIEYFDADIAVELITVNTSNMNIIPAKAKTLDFYLKLIKKDPPKYLKYLPDKYLTDEVIVKIGSILEKRKDNRKFYDELPINKLIIDKFPGLLGQFSDKIIMKVIKEELCDIIANNLSIDTVIDKYGLSNKTIINILAKIKEKDIKTYKKVNKKIEEHNSLEYTNIQDDMLKLETIILSLGKVSRRKLTSEKKQEIAYLIRKYVHTPLEVIYTYNNSYLKEDKNEVINNFIEYVLEYSLLIDRYEGLAETRKITYENPWLKDFDFNKFFNIVNGIPMSSYKYGAEAKELTMDMAKEIINQLTAEEIPLNTLIVSIAFRRYFKGELEDYIKELHSLDEIFIESKRKKREV